MIIQQQPTWRPLATPRHYGFWGAGCPCCRCVVKITVPTLPFNIHGTGSPCANGDYEGEHLLYYNPTTTRWETDARATCGPHAGTAPLWEAGPQFPFDYVLNAAGGLASWEKYAVVPGEPSPPAGCDPPGLFRRSFYPDIPCIVV